MSLPSGTRLGKLVATMPADSLGADMLPDFSRLLVSVPTERQAVTSLTLVFNWAAGVSKR